MLHLNLLPLATAAAQDTTTSTIYMVVMFAIIIVVFYFLLIRPQRKKDKQTQKMRSSIQVGDEITTVGGIMGRVVTIKDDTLIIETGADRSKIRIKKWAVQNNETIHENI
jgi:preprotein translocase subunit YajC